MVRKLLATAVLGFTCTATTYAEDAAKPGVGKAGKGFDKGAIFAKIDADSDGKVTKDEFAKFAEVMSDRIQDKAGKQLPEGFSDKLFAKLDANGDGAVTKEEFEKAGPLLGGQGGFRGKGKAKPEDAKPAQKVQ